MTRRPPAVDVLIAAGALVAVVAEQMLVRGDPLAAALSVPGCVALAWRRTAPVASCLTVIAFLGGTEFVEPRATDAFSTFAVIVLALFSLAAHGAPRRPVPTAIAAIVLLSAVAIQASAEAETLGEAVAGGILFTLVILVGPAFAVGLGVRRHAELRRRLTERARELEAERELHAAAAADEERGRVAGDLHDAVAEGVRAMLADVRFARAAVHADPAGAGPAILGVEERGREALAEMRRVLGVMRRGDEDLALAPHPSLARLDELARRRSSAGRPVALRVEGSARPVSPGLDVAAYRVVEEALDLAPSARRADVLVRWTPRDIELEVAVDGPELADAAAAEAMRERVALFSGRLEAGRRAQGGSAVRAALPAGAAS